MMNEEEAAWVKRINRENEATIFPDVTKRRLCQIIRRLDNECREDQAQPDASDTRTVDEKTEERAFKYGVPE
jgi:hypothetical protein